MSSVKLKHSSGNGTIINGPAANPSADITLKVPSTTGSAGQALKVASANHSSTNAELEWGGSGKILKVVSFSFTSLDDITSKTWTDTSLTKSITTTAADTSVLALVSISWAFNRSSASGGFGLRLLRDSTTLYQGEDDGTNGPEGFYIGPFNGNAVWRSFWTPTYLDVIGTHNAGVAYTYKVQAAVSDESSSDRIRINKASSAKSTITLMEVAA
tara:strand:+ start:4008 stop:4649 length:642 start_codon:yes stop_codon:yes gene_type:complete